MDDRESPTNDQQLNLQDFLPIDTRVERIKTCLTLPDENKNQLNDSKPEALKSSDATMGRVEQDSINNNENSGDYTSSCQDDETDKPPRRFTADEMLALGRCAFEKESLRKTQRFSRKDASPAQQNKTDIQATVSERNEDGNNPNPNPNPNANCSQKDPSQTLQALFSVLRKEFEQMDSQVLPLCLHQIAETYFQDGEYEKAMKFIQLERLYHEQLLANLSSIQQQWEKKWKAATSNEVPQAKYSAKGLNNEELDRLAELCTSHQEPLISRSKLISKEKSLKHEGSLGLVVSEDVKEKGAAANDSDIQTWPGIEPKKETHHGQTARSEVFQPENHCVLQEKARWQLLSGKDPMEEEPSTAESTLEPPTQATGEADTPRSGCLSPRDAEDDGGLQLREEETFSEDVAKIEAAAEKSAAEHSREPMVDTLVLTEADHGSLDLISTEDNVSSERNFLKSTPCPGSVVTSTSQLASSKLSQQQPDDGNDRKSVQNRTAAVRTNVCPESNMPGQTCAAYEEGQEEKEVLGEERKRGEPEDFFDRFFNDSIKDREDSEIPQEQALYNSPDGYSLEESFSSLDELAKRIEIAETVPAEGLVSILKKRDDAESKALAQMQQRQSKRRVRFQEMDDTLDQGKTELKNTSIILCDVGDPTSLANMAKQTSLVLSCVGPYRFFGEPVVKACIENGTSCIDISGEPQFLEGMYLNYNDKAAEAGAYIIGSCGFDSIPADMGVLYTRDNLKGTLTAVESFFTVNSGPEGSSIHDGTWKSVIYGLSDKENLKKIRREIGYKPLPVTGAKLKKRGPVFYKEEFSKYAIPFMGSDVAVVKRTQQYLHSQLQETPVQYAAYTTIGGIGSVIKLMFAGLLFLMLVKFSFGRKLLIKYPEFFSGGYFTKKGPTEKQMEGTSFEMTFFGEGYSTGQDPRQGKPNVKICTQVKGPEPGYIATPIVMVQAAVAFLKDKSSLPKKGGVYTPGAAFAKTKLIDRLNKHGVEFSVISKPEV